ncbi:hypothetical protein IC232_05415 [Microvirga sp. BT688]|uniref:hypothetical protein n=1 Tax=Microvirga sp. TaxID=1873136 RepID=UPI001686C2C9|nr:hypothetical protein [Microvirga sp.]MBD2746136.1 hypothetical protein [Microvirga sp.]
MHPLNSRLLALGIAVAASLSLAGCFESKTKAIEVGEDVGFPSKAFCTTLGKKKIEQLPAPEIEPNGGVIYRSDGKPNKFAFKKVNKNLYLAQEETQGKYRFGYLWRDDKKLRTLVFPPQITEGTRKSVENAGLTLSPQADGFQELVGKQADLQRFLLSPNIDNLVAFSECSFDKPADWDPPLIGQVRKNMSREEVMSLPGATECGDNICFSDLGLARINPRSQRNGSGQIRVKFSEQGVNRISVRAKGLDLGWQEGLLNKTVQSLLLVPYTGDEGAFVFLQVNGDQVLYSGPDATKLSDDVAKRLGTFHQEIQRRSHVANIFSNQSIRFLRIVLTDSKGIEAIKDLADLNAAIHELGLQNRPYIDFTLEREKDVGQRLSIDSQH